MYKNFLIALAIVTVTGGGLFATNASALTANDVQTQVAKLQAQIQELSAQITRLRGQDPAATSAGGSWMPGKHRVCALLTRNLDRGAEGDDVRGLQEYLYENKFLTVTPTGYFGSMTADAVGKWQSSEGISKAGAFGPMSRERLKIWCGGSQVGDVLSASPQKGSAPLSVTFSSKIGDGTTRPSAYDGQDTVLDFGDGSEPQWISCGTEANAMQKTCANPVKVSHTYVNNGTYTATLKKSGGFCAGTCPETTIAKVQISVGTTQACTKEYRPVCGSKPIVCITSPCNSIPTEYGNKCMMEADGATFLYEGQCRSENPGDDAQCKSWFDGCNTCSRSAPGEAAACTLMYCAAPGKAYCTARFSDSTNKAPVISGLSGPSTLSEDSTGTWTVKAKDPEGGTLSYQVWWGDENVYASNYTTATAAREFTQSTTFSHAYSNPGTYTVSVTVRDAAGNEAKTTTSVKVTGSNTVCTEIYQPVCGRPAGCANTCASGMVCTMQCQLHNPQTYSNRCALSAAGAEFLHEGQCTATSGNWY